MRYRWLLALFVSACGFGTQSIEELDPDAIPQVPVYNADVAPIVEYYCIACHQGKFAADDVILSEEADVLAFCDLIAEQVFLSRDMPPGAARRLAPSEEVILKRWMQTQNQIDPSFCSSSIGL
jgi:uncharacterized membrane protein